MSAALKGHCLCGAVRVVATPKDGLLTICHCDNCRRFSSGAHVTFAVEPDSLEVTGPVSTYSAYSWAERGFCAECGSAVWYKIVGDGPFSGLVKLSAGLFDNAAGLDLAIEFFIDRKPHGYTLSGDHTRMTQAEVMALLNSSDTGDAR